MTSLTALLKINQKVIDPSGMKITTIHKRILKFSSFSVLFCTSNILRLSHSRQLSHTRTHASIPFILFYIQQQKTTTKKTKNKLAREVTILHRHTKIRRFTNNIPPNCAISKLVTILIFLIF